MKEIKITVFCEMTKSDIPTEVSFELTSKAYSLVKDFEKSEVQVLIVGRRINYDKIIDKFSRCGANKVIIVSDEIFKDYSSNHYRKAITEILNQEKPDIVLFGATAMGRELAPLVATELKTGLTADCTELLVSDDGKLEAIRPTFGGKMNAAILCKTLPQMATVRPNVFKIIKNKAQNTKVDFCWIDTNEEKTCAKSIEILIDLTTKKVDLSKADLIFSGGKGLKSKENFNKLYELAKLAKGYVGASRGAVDMGIAPPEIQVGQTGQNVRAKIYIAFGISGMAQHLSGINSCDKIIAVNNDESAPIFKFADIGIVGDAVEIIDKLTEKYKNSMEN